MSHGTEPSDADVIRRLVDKMRAQRAPWASLPWTTPLADDARGLLPASRVRAVFPASSAVLSPVARVALARLLTAADHEAFILFEEAVIVALQTQHARLAATDPRRALLAQFIAEEATHIDVFWRYLQTRLPELYAARRFRFKSARARHLLLATVAAIARVRPAAVYVFAEFFEILTIRLAGVLADARSVDAAGVDPLLVAMHGMHAAEEGRHIAADRALVGADRLDATASHLSLAVFAAIGLIESRSYRTIGEQLVQRCPEARRARRELVADARLTTRTDVVHDTVTRFMPTFDKLSPGRLLPLYRMLMLREPWRGRHGPG